MADKEVAQWVTHRLPDYTECEPLDQRAELELAVLERSSDVAVQVERVHEFQ